MSLKEIKESLKDLIKIIDNMSKKDAPVGSSTEGYYNPRHSDEEDEEPTLKGQLEDCVAGKIPKIIEDHPEMDRDQQIRVAYEMCRERLGKTKCKACGNQLIQGHQLTCEKIFRLKKDIKKQNSVQVFTVNRQADESGHSGTGHIITGITFENGTTVIRWNTPTWSIGIYNDYEEFHMLHIGQHPTNESLISSRSLIIEEDGEITERIY